MKICIVLSVLAAVAYGAVLPEAPNGRIAGGELASKGQFPYMVSFMRKGKHYCGGAILNQRWVLTAAHCIKDYDPATRAILAGTTSISEGGDLYQVDKVIMHDKKWDEVNFGNDIGLVHVTEDIVFNDLVQPISINREYVQPASVLRIAGWGIVSDGAAVVDDLYWVDLTSITQEKCQEGHKHIVRDDMMCTYTKVGEGACQGDSGGPLVLDGKVAGLSSWGKMCGGRYPNVYTRVASFADWVDKTMKDNS